MNGEKEILEVIGRNLKIVRQNNNKTKRKVANALGVTQNTVCNFESGKSNNLILFFKYCYIFGVHIGVNMTNENK